MSQTIRTDDNETSKLEVALDLAKKLISGTWAVWAFAIGFSILAPAIDPSVSIDTAKEVSEILLPINTGSTSGLLGFILGKSK